MSKKNRAKSHIKQRYFRKIVPRIKKEGPSKTGGSRSDPSEVTSVDGGQSYGEIFDSQADRINRKSSKSSGGRRSIDSALDEILPEREKVVKSDKKSKNKKNRSFIMGQDVLQKMHSSRNDKERNSNRDVSNRAKNPASNFSRNKSSRSVAFPAMKLIKVVRESEGGVQRMNESSIRSLNLSSVLKDRTIIMDTKSAFLGGQSSYKTSASILQEKRKFHAQRLARRNALIICLLVTMAMITFSCLLLYIFGIFGDEQEFRSYPFKRSTTSFATSTKVSIWVEDYDLIATTTRLFPRSTSTIPTIGSTTTTTKVTEKPWIDPKSKPAFDDEVTTTTTMVKKSSTTTKVEDVTIKEDSSPSETIDYTVSTTTPKETTTLVWPDYVSWADYGYEDIEEKTTTTPPNGRTKSNKRRTKTLSTTPSPLGGRETTPALQKTTTAPMNATSGRLAKFRTSADNRITKEKKITKDVNKSWIDWL